VDNLHTDRFIAILSVLVQAAFSFQGMELIAMQVAPYDFCEEVMLMPLSS